MHGVSPHPPTTCVYLYFNLVFKNLYRTICFKSINCFEANCSIKNSLDTKLKYTHTHVVGGWGDTPCIMLRIVNTIAINGSPNIREGSPFKLTKKKRPLAFIHYTTIKSKI